jgi:hypothetical protein
MRERPLTAQDVVVGLINRPERRLPDVAELVEQPEVRDAVAALAEDIDMLRQSVGVVASAIHRLSAREHETARKWPAHCRTV